ncbi:type II toxin-antitoxin system RatA family toxin [Alginatibacterium sediminis]|uniref:Type II toxin-antitoxin system RatA family toxin n=1 Tax=Alginatibacterium sediminis TaxID=2164068 RepID=A0A420E9Z9_9ALTE|nr:type II toxin-antitoxin system RatA family toxin [Alginatibacterium sediminis]RKF17507.1 type II toxin-antitoxin system RatA family toxin [Alginatibacterium sediminis]
MQQVQRSALVGFSAQQMYNLVNKVEDYPKFLPGCVDSKVIEHDQRSMLAEVSIAKAGIRNAFVTRNQLSPDESIVMHLDKGPFKSLLGEWRFEALDEQACKVILDLKFEFSNKLVAAAFGKVFSELANNMVKAFTQRAKEVYT